MKFRSIRDKLILGVFLGCLIPYIIGGIYIEQFTEDWFFQREVDHLDRLLEQIAFTIDESFIKNMENTVALIARDERLSQYVDNIRSYGQYESSEIEGKTSEEAELERFFGNFRLTHDDINFVFYGANNGAYMESPEFTPTTNYDPRIRPWYMGALTSDKVLISEPYITKFSKETIISFTKKVSLDDQRIGVCGISVKLDTIKENISNINLGKAGNIIVVNNHDTVLMNPVNENWEMKTLSQIGDETMLSLDLNTSSHYVGAIDGVDTLICVYASPYSNWRYIALIDNDAVISDANFISNILLIIYTATLMIVFIIIFQISKRFSRPILEISEEISSISNFNFDELNTEKLNGYIKRSDEIGIISRAINVMYKSYKELRNNINELDDEIRVIDITKETNYQLTLSEKNPFNSFTISVNKLLVRVQNYLKDLKKQEKELLEKNELLSSSEEELMAQLEEIDSQKEYINFLAFHDPLTELPNRRKFYETLGWALNNDEIGAVLLLDLDNFKSINDMLGHVFGDKVLKVISEKLSEHMSDDFFISRFGGDEFLMLARQVTSNTQIKSIAKQIAGIFDERFIIDDHEVDISISMGISMFPADSNDVDQLIMNADLALYSVKNQGKNGYRFFTHDMTEHLLNKSEIEAKLREAIANDGFHMVYQPQVDCYTGKVMAYEALVRLNEGTVGPADFIAVAEENGMITKIGRIVTEKVIAQLSEWLSKGYPVKPIAINFSVVQIHDAKYIDFILGLLQKYEVPAELIEIEITENVFIDNKEQSLNFMGKLKKHGLKIAIDDFGTGYSSLSYLTFLPIDKIKLDRSLNMKFLEIENIKVMDSLISLAHSLNFKVIAEGIEHYEHVRRLQVGTCDGIQGYYFSKPLSVTTVEAQFYMDYHDKVSQNIIEREW